MSETPDRFPAPGACGCDHIRNIDGQDRAGRKKLTQRNENPSSSFSRIFAHQHTGHIFPTGENRESEEEGARKEFLERV